MGLLDTALRPRGKAEVGPGVASFLMNPQLGSFLGQRDPHAIMAEAQAIYKRNAWVAAAERAIGQRALQTAFRLEDGKGETITSETHPQAAEVLNILGDAEPVGGPVSITQLATATRRGLWSITLRHLGLCGCAFWLLDEREVLTGTPRRVLYVNPCRLSPAMDGRRMLGWVLDDPRNKYAPRGSTPVPLQLEEVQVFTLEPDDDSVFGIGIAEAAHQQIRLSRLATDHASGTLALGGRLTGIVSPSPSAPPVNPDEWESVIRDWRNLASDPDSAKRLQVIRAPVEFTQLAASPADLQLSELLGGTKQDILAAWSVPTSQVGIVGNAGLNSGESRHDDAEVLWEGAVKPRLDALREGIQAILNRWEPRLGFRPTLVFDVPTFDDLEPAFGIAEKAKVLPMTNNERRAQVGLDPLEDELGDQVWMDKTMVPVSTSTVEAQPGTGELTASESAGKADTPLRQRVERRWLGDLTTTVRRLLTEQRDAIAVAVEAKWSAISRKPGDTFAWWNADRWDAAWEKALRPVIEGLAKQTTAGATAMVPNRGKADPLSDVVNLVVRTGAGRVTGINTTTRDAIRSIVTGAVRDGLSPSEAAQRIRDATAFDDARSELIARTETMLAYNEAALGTFRNFGVEYVDALDGDADEVCASRVAANPWPLEDARGQVDHPNGTLDWAPVVGRGKAAVPPAPQVHVYMPEPLIPAPLVIPPAEVTVRVPRQPAPYVSVEAPIVNVAAPIVEAPVTVNVPQQPAPIVNVEAAKATGPQEVIVTSLPPRGHVVKRDKQGKVQGSVETDL